jgi:spore coat polysaccharide biosynthesis protein SpsF
MRCGCVIQARLDSTRLCHKVLREIGCQTVLELICYAAKDSRLVDEVCLTTPDLALFYLARDTFCVYPHWYTEARDPLEEYYRVAKACGYDIIVRLTADCPMITSEAIDSAVAEFINSGADYGYNNCDGCDVEVFAFAALEEAHANAGPDEHEHVSTWIRRHKRCVDLTPPIAKIPFKSLDTLEDLQYIRMAMGKT